MADMAVNTARIALTLGVMALESTDMTSLIDHVTISDHSAPA